MVIVINYSYAENAEKTEKRKETKGNKINKLKCIHLERQTME